MTDRKQFLFVAGAPRSGTTGLTHALNSIETVQLGIELFPHVIHPDARSQFGADLFGDESLADALARNRNVVSAAEALARFKNNPVIGDKHPHYHRLLREMQTNFPNYFFVMIYRDLLSVCRSFHVRYVTEGDSWRLPGFRAIGYWFSAAASFLQHHAEAPDKVLLVSYERLFDAPPEMAEAYFRELHGKLGKTLGVGRIDNPTLLRTLHRSDQIRTARAPATGTDLDLQGLFQAHAEDGGKYTAKMYEETAAKLAACEAADRATSPPSRYCLSHSP